MATGLRIRNQGTGQIQIGSSYRNLELVKSGTLNTASFIGGGDITYNRADSGFLSSTLGNDLMHVVRFPNSVISAASGFVVMQEQTSCKLYANKDAPNKLPEYYTFGYSPNQPSGPVGLRMRNPDGTTYYDSRRKGLRVLATIVLPAPIEGERIALGQFFPGTLIGVAMPNPRRYWRAPYPEICYSYCDRMHMDTNNNLFVSRESLWSQNLGSSSRFPVGNTYNGSQDSVAFVVDLTGLPLGFG